MHRAVGDRSTMLYALGTLSEAERESLLLIAWEGLGSRDAARIAGCSVRAFHVRLHRARACLARALDATDSAPDHGTFQR